MANVNRRSRYPAHQVSVPEQRFGISEILKRIGFAKDNQVRFYEASFDLLSDPIVVADTLVLVDAIETKTGRIARVRIPPTIVRKATLNRP